MSPETLASKAASGPNCFLYREAEQNGYVDHSLDVCSSGIFYARAFADDRERQLRCYLCESLLTALEHPEPIIRVRAAVQCFAYAGRLEGMGTTPGPRHCDALLAIRNWLESIARPVAA